jgi:hypothetical protein
MTASTVYYVSADMIFICPIFSSPIEIARSRHILDHDFLAENRQGWPFSRGKPSLTESVDQRYEPPEAREPPTRGKALVCVARTFYSLE